MYLAPGEISPLFLPTVGYRDGMSWAYLPADILETQIHNVVITEQQKLFQDTDLGSAQRLKIFMEKHLMVRPTNASPHSEATYEMKPNMAELSGKVRAVKGGG